MMIFKDRDIAFENNGELAWMVILDKKSNSRYMICAYPKSEKLYFLKEIQDTLTRVEMNRDKLGVKEDEREEDIISEDRIRKFVIKMFNMFNEEFINNKLAQPFIMDIGVSMAQEFLRSLNKGEI